MALVDEATGEFSNAAFGLDTQAALADQPSLLESAGNVVTKGIPLTGLAIVNSIANTAFQVQSWATGSGAVRAAFGLPSYTGWTMDAELKGIGADSYEEYYQKHQQGIEGAAFAIGALVPGTAGVKALKLAQAGKFGEVMQRATGLFAGVKAEALADAAAQINAGDAALFGQLGVAKLKAVAAGFGDQALQALAFETAVAGTMKASPILNDQDFGDIATNMLYGVLLGGIVGGSLESIFTLASLRKAAVTADVATKQAELTTRFGFHDDATYNGISIAGDRVVLLVQSIDKIPTDLVSQLAQKKITDTTNRAWLDSRTLLSGLAGKGNEDLSTKLMDMLVEARAQGAGKEELYERLAGLAKISRITEAASINTSDTFYVNRFANKEQLSFSDLVTASPHPTADLSLRYQLKQFTTYPIIATAADTFEATNGARVPLYGTVKEAFEGGADIYVDAKLGVHVNPQAPNIERIARPGEGRTLGVREEQAFRVTGKLPVDSKPLTGAPLILNTVTKAVTSDATPVVGDFGAARVVGPGLAYGEKLSLQSVDKGLTAETETIDANARYLWASRRGIKAGDTIGVNDIPMLESMYAQATTSGGKFEEYIDGLRQRKVTFSDGSDLPYSSSELLSKIQGSKDDLIHDLIVANPKMSHEEIAIRANVPEKYIEDGFQSRSPTDYIVPPEQWATANHVKLEYDIGNTNTQDGQILRGMLDSQQRIKVIAEAAHSAVAKEYGPGFENLLINKLSSKDATVEGTGAKFLTFSNSDYGTLGQQTERIGRFVTNWLQEKMAGQARILAPAANAIRDDPIASAELGAFVNIRRRTGEQYVFLPSELATKYWRTADTAVLRSSLVRDKTGAVVDWNPNFTPSGFLPGAALVDNAVRVPEQALHTFYDLSPKVAAWERAQLQINNERIVSRNNWYSAQGVARSQELGTLYAPPIDTAKYPYFALVRAREGQAFTDGSVSMITADSAANLEKKMASLRSDYDVITKDMQAQYHKALGDFQYDRNFTDSRVNADLTRRGILNDVYPDTRADTIIQQYIDFNTRQTTRLVRDFVELGNAQPFAEIRAMGAKFTGAETSQTGFVGKYFGRSANNPYESYVKTALAIGPRDEYVLWNSAQEKLEAFADTAFNTAKQAINSVAKGLLPLEEASPIMERMGLGNGYSAAMDIQKAYYGIANQLPDTRVLSRVVSAGNLFQSATAVRLDVWQSLINIISMPILTAAEGSSAVARLTSGALRTELPDGSGRQILSTTKAIYGAIQDFWNSDMRAEWVPLFMKMNITRPNINEYFQAVKDLAIPSSGTATAAVLDGVNKAVEVGARLTLSQWSENAIRTISAFTAKRIFESAGYNGTDLIDQIGTFVNRTHGNYIASQRPVAFQGPIGQAMSLFQTYQFNFYQQMFRYMENGEAKTLGIMAALQTGLFGMQSLPGFQMINQHIVGNAAGNIGHGDLYSTGTNFFDKKLGDYLLYGIASNWLNAGLYSRGDINPRSISVLPLNPLDYPAISGSIGFISNLLSTTDKIVQGGGLTESLMQGLEHNGISRPLAGLGQLMQGYVSTAKGDLVSAVRPQMGDNTAGLSDVISIANFTRLAGARPLDEAITMDMLYRSTLYAAKDTSRIERLGAAVKEGLVGNAPLDTTALDGFLKSYAEAGGQIQRFGQEMMRWTQEANVAKANNIFRELEKPMARQMMIEMGGQPLPDFRNKGNINPAMVPQLPNTTRTGVGAQTIVPVLAP